MSLFRQVLFLFVFLIISILSVVIFININNDRNFLQGQLQSNAQNVAITLSLSLSESMKNKDLVLSETILDSVYDSGYYEYIKLFDINGNILLDKRKNIVVKDVPKWFIDLIEFDLKSSKANVTAGWQNFGSVEVKNHTGYAYFKLWETFTSLFESILLIFFIGMVVIFIGLKILLRSLSNIKQQALAIAKNSFIKNNDKPFTTEFRTVILAMNSMVGKVEDIFNKEVEYLNKYNNILYKDNVLNNISNRRFFIMKLNEYLGENSNYNGGIFMFFTISNLDKVKEKKGFASFKIILSDFAAVLTTIEESYPNAVFAKLNEYDFAMIIPTIKISNIRLDIENRLNNYTKYLREFSNELLIHAAILEYTNSEIQKTLLSKSDNLLAKAKQSLSHKIEYETNAGALISLGKEEWNLIIKELKTTNDYFRLAFQSSIDCSTDIELSKEVYLRFVYDESIYSANQILPIINELKLQDEINKFVIESVYEYLSKTKRQDYFTINIDSKFIHIIENLQWLHSIFDAKREFAKHISFEATLKDIMSNIEVFTSFVENINKIDIKFGIDNFVLSESYNYLNILKPSYIKVDKSILLDLLNDNNSGVFNSLDTITKTLDIQIIATSVEDGIQKQILMDNKIVNMQGRFISQTALLE